MTTPFFREVERRVHASRPEYRDQWQTEPMPEPFASKRVYPKDADSDKALRFILRCMEVAKARRERATP